MKTRIFLFLGVCSLALFLRAEEESPGKKQSPESPSTGEALRLEPKWKIAGTTKAKKQDEAYNQRLDELVTLIRQMADNSERELLTSIERGRFAHFKELLARGINVNAALANGTTALMVAVQKGEPAFVKALLEKGANVHAHNKEGSTALKMAGKQKTPEMTQMLQKAGARE